MGGGLNGQDAFSGRIIPVEPAYPIQDCREMVKKQNGLGIGDAGAPAYTIDTTGAQGVSQGLRVRRLTPLECERLMGFKDDYTNITRKAKRGTDGSRYRALGNSMAVNCMRWIGQRIQLVEDTLNHMEAT
jgi:site-specific DNA-cytosine methylase